MANISGEVAGEEMGEELNMSWVYRAPLLCGDEAFFDSRLSWDTDDPLVSVCAQKSLLLWLPCALLWLLAPLQGYRLMRSKARHIPHSLLNVVKTVLAIGLLILAIADLITFASAAGSKMDLLDPVLRGITWVLVAALIEAERTRGVRNSALLWVFWLVYLLCQVCSVNTEEFKKCIITGTASLQPSTEGGKRPGRHCGACFQFPYLRRCPAPVDPLLFHGFRARICHRSRYTFLLTCICSLSS